MVHLARPSQRPTCAFRRTRPFKVPPGSASAPQGWSAPAPWDEPKLGIIHERLRNSTCMIPRTAPLGRLACVLCRTLRRIDGATHDQLCTGNLRVVRGNREIRAGQFQVPLLRWQGKHSGGATAAQVRLVSRDRPGRRVSGPLPNLQWHGLGPRDEALGRRIETWNPGCWWRIASAGASCGPKPRCRTRSTLRPRRPGVAPQGRTAYRG